MRNLPELTEPERIRLARNIDRFCALMSKLRKRYTTPDGWIVTHEGGKPTKYTRLEDLAWKKYVK